MNRDQASKLLKRWRAGYAGFLAFLADTELQVLEAGRWKTMTLFPWQEQALRGFFATDPAPRTLVFVVPRRSGKTTLAGAVVVWLAFTRPNQLIGCGANSREQATNVPFKMLAGMVLRSPLLLELAGGPGNVQADRIVLPHVGSEIRALPTSPAAVYGIGFSAAWISELAAGDPELFDVVASGVLDRPDGLVIVDSTPSGPTHLLSRLHLSAANQGGEDATVYCYHREWHEGEPPLNPNLQEKDLLARARQMLPDQFAREHRGEWCGSSSGMFSLGLIDACTIPEPPTVEDLLQRYRRVQFGLGLDLALSMSKHGDRSFAVLVARAVNPITPDERDPYGPHEREEFYIMRVTEVPDEPARQHDLEEIKQLLGRWPDGVAVEVYQSQGFSDHCRRVGITPEVIHASPREQAEAFTRWHVLMTNGQLFIPASAPFAELRRQMAIFECDTTGAVPSFGVRGVKRGSNRDDACFATTWAIYSTRQWSLQRQPTPPPRRRNSGASLGDPVAEIMRRMRAIGRTTNA